MSETSLLLDDAGDERGKQRFALASCFKAAKDRVLFRSAVRASDARVHREVNDSASARGGLLLIGACGERRAKFDRSSLRTSTQEDPYLIVVLE